MYSADGGGCFGYAIGQVLGVSAPTFDTNGRRSTYDLRNGSFGGGAATKRDWLTRVVGERLLRDPKSLSPWRCN